MTSNDSSLFSRAYIEIDTITDFLTPSVAKQPEFSRQRFKQKGLYFQSFCAVHIFPTLDFPIPRIFFTMVHWGLIQRKNRGTWNAFGLNTRVGTLIVATIYLQLIQN